MAVAEALGNSMRPNDLQQGLECRSTADGSFSLWSAQFGEGFHSGRGAVREARDTFVAPAELERFSPGSTLRVLELCVGTGSNTAALLEACNAGSLQLQWWGLELDPEPLRLALAADHFRQQWQPQALAVLEQLQHHGRFQGPPGQGQLLWGDARQTLAAVLQQARGTLDLVLHDAFSPRHCPELWTVEVLEDLAALLQPQGRLITYCSAAAVRQGLRLSGLELAAIPAHAAQQQGSGSSPPHRAWSGGTAASPTPLQASSALRALSALELEHLATSAAEPYRDPSRSAEAAVIVGARQRSQSERLARGEVEASSAWRRRWGLEHPA